MLRLISPHHRGKLGPTWRRAFSILASGPLIFFLFHSSAFAQFCPTAPRAVTVGDFNGDGKLDVAVIARNNPNVFIFKGNGNGTFQATPIVINSGMAVPSSIVAGRFGGSHLDIVVAGFSTTATSTSPIRLSVLQGDGAGGFLLVPAASFSTTQTLSVTFPAVAAADFNGDERQDLALVDGRTTMSIFLQNNDGSFSRQLPDKSIQASPADIAAGNFNATLDGHVDIAVAKRITSLADFTAGHTVALFSGNGAGGFTRQPDLGTDGAGPQSIVAGDFNNDGFPDLAVLHVNFDFNDVSIFLGNGSGGFSRTVTSPNFPAGENGVSLLALDFNGDGKLDLAVATTNFNRPNQNDDRIFVLLGDGHGNFSTAFEFPLGLSPRSIAPGDFNGDGRPDFVASSYCGLVQIILNPLPPPGKAMVYVTNREDDTVSVIDPEINQVIDTVGVGHKPHGITLTPDGKEAYVANRNDDNVSVIKTGTTSGSNTELLTVPVGQKPEGVRAANIPTKGTKVFVANRNDDTISVIDADPLSSFFHTVISTVSLPKPKNHKPIAIAFSPDGAFAYLAAEESNRLFVVDAKLAIDDPANAVLTSVSVGKHPKAVHVSNDGKRIYVANRGDSTVSKLTTEAPGAPASPQLIATIKVAKHPEGVTILPNGTVYVTSREANKITVINTNGTVIASIPVGKHPLGIDILPSGGFAYVAEEGDDSVTVIDTSSNSVAATIPVGKHPQRVAAGTVPIASP